MSGNIHICEMHRGVGIHDFQSSVRIESVVKPAIDRVGGISDIDLLFIYAADVGNPPEARLLAAARCEASWQLAAERRELRPDVDLDRLRAITAGLGSLNWIGPTHYGSDLDPCDGAVPRDVPLQGRAR